MDCPEKNILHELCRGALGENEDRELRAHIKNCAACRADFDALREIDSLTKNIESALPPEGYFAGLQDKINRRIDDVCKNEMAAPRKVRRRAAGVFFFRKLLPVAAVFLLFAGIGTSWFLFSERKEPLPRTNASAPPLSPSNIARPSMQMSEKPGDANGITKEHIAQAPREHNGGAERLQFLRKKRAGGTPALHKQMRAVEKTVRRHDAGQGVPPAPAREQPAPEPPGDETAVAQGAQAAPEEAAYGDEQGIANGYYVDPDDVLMIQAANNSEHNGNGLEYEIMTSGALQFEVPNGPKVATMEANRNVLYLLQVVNSENTATDKAAIWHETNIALRRQNRP